MNRRTWTYAHDLEISDILALSLDELAENLVPLSLSLSGRSGGRRFEGGLGHTRSQARRGRVEGGGQRRRGWRGFFRLEVFVGDHVDQFRDGVNNLLRAEMPVSVQARCGSPDSLRSP